MASTFSNEQLAEIVSGQGGDTTEASIALELAAVLGSPVDLDEWAQACELGGVDAEPAIFDILVDRGVGRWEDQRFVFSEPEQISSLLDQARAEGRLRSHHAACARMLFARGPDPGRRQAARRATHLVEAGRREAALPALLEAEKEVYDVGDMDEAGQFLDRRDHLIDELELSAEDERVARAQNQWRRARILFAIGQRERAADMVAESLEVLEQTDWASECGSATLLRGRILRDHGQLDAALECFDKAVSYLAVAGDEHGLSMARASRALVLLFQGKNRLARKRMLEVLRDFEMLGDEYMLASLRIFVAQTWLVDGNVDKAIATAETAREVARRAGHRPNEAAAWNFLGEVARFAEDWERARVCYSKAAELYESDGTRSEVIARYNLALAEIGAGDYGAARGLLEQLEDRYAEAGLKARVSLVLAGLMTCAAGTGDWEAWQAYGNRIRELIDSVGTAHHDLAWMGEQSCRLADASGEIERRREALEFACAQHERLGHPERAEKLMEMYGEEPRTLD